MAETIIRWATHSWNPYDWHCNKVSEGCKNCYMIAQAERYGQHPIGTPNWRGKNAMRELRSFKSGSVLFVNSMSDSYHESVPASYIHAIHNIAAYVRPDLTFLLLTKRPERAYAMRDMLVWPDNLWLGTSVEMEKYLYRLDYLLETPAAGHFVSAEPLLEAVPGIGFYLKVGKRPSMLHGRIVEAQCSLKWVIVGGESGGNRRPFNKDWAKEIRDMCDANGVKFMFKQGSAFKSEQDKMLDGHEYSESPFSVVEHKTEVKPVQMELFAS